MIELLFENLPEKPAKADSFDDVFWPSWPHKVDKKNSRKALKRALNVSSLDIIMSGVHGYVVGKPSWREWKGAAAWLNGEMWKDWQPANPDSGSPNLAIIAAHAKQPWCERGKYTRDVLQRCVDAELLTQEEAEDKS